MTQIMQTCHPLYKQMLRPAVDKPASERLERFVFSLGRRYRSPEARTKLSLDKLADAFCREFDISVPVMPKASRILADMGVGYIGRRTAEGLDGSYDYNAQRGRWEFYIAPDLRLLESNVIMHEAYEFLFWRCFHQIDWWQEWAEQKNYVDPHNQADSFAALVVLPYWSFMNAAKRHKCNIWSLSGYCEVSPGYCFYAINRFVKYDFPFFHALLHIDVKFKQLSMFPDDDNTNYKVLMKAFMQPQDEKMWKQVSAQCREAAYAMEDIHMYFPPKDSIRELVEDDIVNKARLSKEPDCLSTNRLAGLHLHAPVDAIVLPNIYETRQVYVQAVPHGWGDIFLEAEGVFQTT